MLLQIRKLSYISCIELYLGKGAQLTRSPGTKSKIVKFDKMAHTAFIELPSKFKKTLSYYTFAFLGHVVPSLHFKCSNIKSGYWRSFGVKSIVRGVAMNPVDHPHGGRTKAIRYPRTPWGHTTKFK